MESMVRWVEAAKRAKMTVVGLLLSQIFVCAPACGANGFKSMAKELSGAAKIAGIERVAVLPFVPADRSNPKDGLNISEKLMTQVVRVGKIQIVERSLLRNLMEEHHLARTGMVNPAMLKKIGQVFSVEAIITGSFVILGRCIVVNARLINVETGVIISATERQVEREWDASQESYSLDREGVFDVQVPELFVAAPPLPSDLPELRDAPTDSSCADAAERVDQLEGQILELKARYWAAKLKKGVSLADIKVNPGSTISDPLLKKNFYDRMKYWYGVENVPELTPSEVRRFVSIDGKAYSLYHECGI